MSVTVLRVAAALYAAGAGAYLLFFARPVHVRAARIGYGLVLVAFIVHAVSIGLACAQYGGTEFLNLRGGLGMLGWIGAGAFLVVQRAYRMPSLGAFIVPLAIIAVVPGIFELGDDASGTVPKFVRLPAFTLHLFTVFGGMALFAIAFGIALMYLLQEREVKGKHFGALFSRLPSLDALDRLNQRLVRAGFALYSVALVTGALVARSAWSSWVLDPKQIAAVAVWLLYGGMVQLRHLGVHGRRYALLTLAGFVLVLGTLIAMEAVPSFTRHGGNLQ